jgi:hypothetical protein
VAVLVHLDSIATHDGRLQYLLGWGAILLVAIGTVLHLRLKNSRGFDLTPLDLIVLFVALVVPSLPGLVDLPNGGALAIATLVILFYGIEVLVGRTARRVVWLRAGVAVVLAALIVRSLP